MANKRTLGRLLLALGVAVVVSKDNKKRPEKKEDVQKQAEKDIVVIVIEA